jgi:hypothetical protein
VQNDGVPAAFAAAFPHEDTSVHRRMAHVNVSITIGLLGVFLIIIALYFYNAKR